MAPPVNQHVPHREAAQAEVGHTTSTPAINGFLTGVFLLTITAVPLLQFTRELVAIRRGELPGRSLPQSLDLCAALLPRRAELAELASPSEGLLTAGQQLNDRLLRDMRAYESELTERDELRQWLVPRLQVPLSAWLRGGNEEVYCGRAGWLFYRRDLDSLTGPGFLEPQVLARRARSGDPLEPPPHPNPLPALSDFHAQLAQRGITLVVVPVPVKPSIYPDLYSAREPERREPLQNRSFAHFLQQLAAANIAHFDPAPLLARARTKNPPLYLKTDTHWTPDAVTLVAEGLARSLRDTVALSPATRQFSTVATEITNRGDLAVLLGLPPGRDEFPPETVSLAQVRDGDRPWRPDPSAEILLLGDSFTNIYSLEAMGWGEGAGLAEQLSRSLGLPLDTLTRNDAGGYATRELLARELARGTDRLVGKKLVIWQFAARELAHGDWRPIALPTATSPPRALYGPPEGRVVQVRGIVRAAAPAPKPGSVPYKDHLSMVHLTDLTSVDDPTATGREAVVLVWSLRDNERTAAATWRPGDTITLRLRPWAEVAGQYEAINRTELDDEELLLAEPAWGE